jgi:branched-chain amino acid transport system permease protein
MKKKPGTLKLILLSIIGIALLIFPFVAKNRYQIHIMNLVGIYMLLSLGLNIAMGYAGQMNLAMGALWAVGAYTAGLLNTRLGFPLWLTLPCAILAGGLVGGFVGLPALKVRAHYLSIVTIGLNEVINIVLVNETKITGGVDGISIIAKQILSGRVGRNFRAIRDDYKTAPAMGVNAGYYKLLAFIISGCFAGAAGALYAHLNAYISPDIFEHKTTLFIMTLTMIGGLGNLNGSLIGSFILPLLQEYLRAIQDWQYVVYGLAIMVVVLFVPGGLMQLAALLKPYAIYLLSKFKKIKKGGNTGEESHVS